MEGRFAVCFPFRQFVELPGLSTVQSQLLNCRRTTPTSSTHPELYLRVRGTEVAKPEHFKASLRDAENKNTKEYSHYGLERCSELQEINRTPYYS